MIENMRSAYNAYQKIGGIKKYHAPDTKEEEKERIRQLLITWCEEVNKFYRISSLSHDKPQNAKIIAFAYFIANRVASDTSDMISQKTEWVEACKLVNQVAEKIFNSLEHIGVLLQELDVNAAQITSYLDVNEHGPILGLFAQALEAQDTLRLYCCLENAGCFEGIVTDHYTEKK